MANKEKSIAELEQEFENAKEALATAKKIQAQKAAEEAERKRAALSAEKDKRKKEVDDAIDNAVELIKKYIEDYGSLSITDHADSLSLWFGSKPWRLFF